VPEEEAQDACSDQIAIERALAIISRRLCLETEEAFEVLYRYARSHSRSLADVATDISMHGLPTEQASGPREAGDDDTPRRNEV
jgi:AmiR/NasT family two-component response regulator